MRISRQADYARRAVLGLSLHPEARIKEVARRQRLSVSYVGRISQRLAKERILDNKRGRLGGRSRASSPDQISILDVIEAIDGTAKVDRCLLAPIECGREKFCPVNHVGQEILLTTVAKLSSVTFASLTNGGSSG